ncbi:hypothetical protein [Helicobacter sp. MIT 14-3879]|uniref:hypothetical protein n=1 Tax=Helicobacter sp. MIT 14-3879 TaxID=2040649 RepID=UPI002161AFA9|nr:hypothetical protein [Helicobacter sp. MIT 14-3879]
MINKLKENAELAWAAYGYYDLIGKKFHTQSKTRKGEFITLHDIMDATYFDYETQDSTFFNTFKLKGDMTPTQAKRFFKRYDLLDFYPKDDSQGFHACLFQNKKSKEYTFVIRGTEIKDI